MQPNLLDQLRDVHTPAPPPDDALQLIALLILLALSVASVLHFVWRWLRPAMPAWQREALASLARAKHMRAPEALTAAAITLRRALMRIDAGAWAANSTGCDYVQRLDALFNVEFFRHGPGEIFGEQLYRERPSSERVARAIDGLHELLRRYRP